MILTRYAYYYIWDQTQKDTCNVTKPEKKVFFCFFFKTECKKIVILKKSEVW